MKIAVICETSAADKNADIIKALEGRGCEIINAGMKEKGTKPELQYIHTGLMSAILLNLNRVDLVVGGCGTGQGFLNAAMQYPGVFCGHILTPLDGWLFTQINGGNCISLALNEGYGWAGDVNLQFIFDHLLSVEKGIGYPPQRKEPQMKSRKMLEEVSILTHRSMAEIVRQLPDDTLLPAIQYPGFMQIVNIDEIEDKEMCNALLNRLS